MLSVLKNAITDLRIGDRKLRTQAVNWFLDKDKDYFYSFGSIATHLNLNLKVVRKLIKPLHTSYSPFQAVSDRKEDLEIRFDNFKQEYGNFITPINKFGWRNSLINKELWTELRKRKKLLRNRKWVTKDIFEIYLYHLRTNKTFSELDKEVRCVELRNLGIDTLDEQFLCETVYLLLTALYEMVIIENKLEVDQCRVEKNSFFIKTRKQTFKLSELEARNSVFTQLVLTLLSPRFISKYRDMDLLFKQAKLKKMAA